MLIVVEASESTRPEDEDDSDEKTVPALNAIETQMLQRNKRQNMHCTRF